jgi:hypothetical protein
MGRFMCLWGGQASEVIMESYAFAENLGHQLLRLMIAKLEENLVALADSFTLEQRFNQKSPMAESDLVINRVLERDHSAD